MYREMKRLSTILMAALMVLAMSCKKNGNDDLAQGPGFRASMENQAGDSKTHLEGLDVKWDNRDAIMVVNVLGSAKEFTTNGEVTEGYADFQSDAPESFYRPNFQAYYPSSIYNAQTRMVTLPETQDYKENSFEQGFNPMAARATDNTLEFKNLCGMLALQLTGSCTVTSIRITAKGGEKLWGTGDVTMGGTDGGMEPTLGTLTGGTSSLTLNCGTGVTLTSTATTFYFVLPVGSLASGFDVLLSDNSGKVWTKSASANTEINRSKIRTMPQLAVVPRNPIVPSTVTLTAGCEGSVYNVGGSVTVPSGGPHTCEFGLVYSATNAEPTLDNGTKVEAGTATFSDTKTFSVDITGLAAGTTYHVRAYAMIEGAAYSTAQDIEGGTTPLPMTWANGRSPKLFTVASGKQVYFSQGNLQYNATGSSATAASGGNVGGTWRFAEHQFDFIGADNKNAAQTYGGWIDLFGWGTSGYNHNGKCYQPWSTSQTNNEYYAYGAYDNNLEGGTSPHTGKADWGKANAISNGGGSSWRTLTKAEWMYLISTRKDGSGNLLYGEGKVGNCTQGLIILPDDWSCPYGVTDVSRGTSLWSNVYSYSQWAQLEAAGAVFLPAAGRRKGTSVGDVGSYGLYWSSWYYDSGYACSFYFGSGDVGPDDSRDDRCNGRSVRLVSNKN